MSERRAAPLYMTGEQKTGPQGLTKRAVAGTAWSSLSTAGQQVLTFASLATVARKLGPDAYGVIGMAALVMAFVANIRDLGTGVAIIQKSTVTRRLLSSLFWINAGLGLLLTGCVAVLAPAAAAFFHKPVVAPVLRYLSMSLFVAACGVVHNALLNREMAFRAIALVDISAAVASYVVAVAGAYSGFGVWSLVFSNLTTTVVSTSGYWISQRFRPAVEFDLTEVRSIVHFSSNLSGFVVVNYACRNADNLIVGRALGSVPLGFYQMAYNMMLRPLQSISSVVTQVLFPAFSLIQDDDARFRQAYVRGCLLIGVVTFPIMAGLAVVADPLVRTVLGAKWLGTIRIFQILAAVGLVQSVQTTVGIIYQAKGRTDWMFRWSFVVLVSTVTAFLVGVRFGAEGVAAAYAIVFLGGLLYPGFAIPFRLIDLRFRHFGRAMLPQLFWTSLMAAVCAGWLLLLQQSGIRNAWLQLSTTCILGSIVYVAGLLLFRPPVVLYLEEILSASENRHALRAARWLSRGTVSV